MTGRALVVDHGESRSALAGARALARAGWEVGAASPAPGGLLGVSRHVVRWHAVPPPERDLDAFSAAVAAACAAGGYDVVFPSEDPQALALSLRREAIPARVPYAPHSVVLRATDKLELARAAAVVGLDSPRTLEASPQAVSAWLGAAVVKARLHNPLREAGRPAHLPVRFPENRHELAAAVEELSAAGGEPLIQEVVGGEQVAVSVVITGDGRVVEALQQTSLRLFPREGGISSRALSVPVDRALLGAVEALLRELGWSGLAQLQFRVPADGRPRLIDLNPRFYGSLALAQHAGLNLPAAWAAVALGRLVGSPDGPRLGAPGRVYQWLEGDLRAAAGGPRPAMAVAEALATAVRAGHSVWDARDPGPGLRLARRVPGRVARTFLGRRR
jgi:predicted ATP-grasp superfamily ATP-dependent carboligase